jgi:hypothetical protein
LNYKIIRLVAVAVDVLALSSLVNTWSTPHCPRLFIELWRKRLKK